MSVHTVINVGVVTGATEHTSDHTQQHPSVTLDAVTDTTDLQEKNVSYPGVILKIMLRSWLQ